jgi:hypothetical protein
MKNSKNTVNSIKSNDARISEWKNSVEKFLSKCIISILKNRKQHFLKEFSLNDIIQTVKIFLKYIGF